MKQAAVLRHVGFEDLGSFGSVLDEMGYAVRYIDAATEQPAGIESAGTDLLVVLGGPIGVYQEKEYPFLTEEIRLVRQRLESDLPTLGICLGSQIIAAALGARVYPGGRSEIGWSPLSLPPAGLSSPLRHLEEIPVLHWHGDTFDLPENATLLASTAIYPHQAFSVGPRILALQFHPEVTPLGLERWYVGHCCEIGGKNLSVPALRRDAEYFSPTLVPAAADVLREWIAAL